HRHKAARTVTVFLMTLAIGRYAVRQLGGVEFATGVATQPLGQVQYGRERRMPFHPHKAGGIVLVQLAYVALGAKVTLAEGCQWMVFDAGLERRSGWFFAGTGFG